MRAPASVATETEKAGLPTGDGERFAGYGVMGLPFASGHVLAMRRFPASSIGPAYTSVWHREPDGTWAFWQDRPDHQSCARYFSNALTGTRTVDIDLSWPGDATLRVVVPDVGLVWTETLASTAATRIFSAAGRVMPDRLWRSRPALRRMGPVAGLAMRAGKVGMVGTSPNGHEFIANPQQVWVIDESVARLGDDDFGPPGSLDEQARLGDFWIPQRGIFAVGRTFFEPGDASRSGSASPRSE